MSILNNHAVIYTLASITIISFLISIPLSFITGKYYDKLLSSKKIPTPLGMGIMPSAVMNRATLYVGYIMWNGPKKRLKKTYRDEIGDFIFRAYARPIDYLLIVLETLNALSLITMVIMGILK